jgi:hypothetical protein
MFLHRCFKLQQVCLLLVFLSYAFADNLSLFPIEHYNQNITLWLNPHAPNYNQKLLSYKYQQARFKDLKQRYYGTSYKDASPWNINYIKLKFSNTINQIESQSIYLTESMYVNQFDNFNKPESKIGYSINFRPYNRKWILKISNNMNIEQFKSFKFNLAKRAIATDNILIRVLPTNDPFYLSNKIAGQGYPFDLLQNSVIYAGTPLYVAGISRNSQWLFVITPSKM